MISSSPHTANSNNKPQHQKKKNKSSKAITQQNTRSAINQVKQS